MKAAFLVSSANPCQFYRMMEPARAFPGAEMVFAGAGFSPEVLDRAAAADIVQLSYVCRPEELEALRGLKARGAKLALDYDDDVFAMGADRELLREVLRLADLLTLATPHLARVFAGAAPGTRWALLPNRIDTTAWVPGADHGARPIIGYAGSPAHTLDFLAVAPAVWAAMRAVPAATLRILGCGPVAVPADLRERVEQRPWQPFSRHIEALTALDADIALAPLRDTAFNRGRSPLKWMQFAALGAAVIATAIPPYASAIEHGRTGVLVRPGSPWDSSLRLLLGAPRVRVEIGRAARAEVCSRHDLSRDAIQRAAAYSLVLHKEQK